MTRILLAGGDHQRRARGARVEQVAHAVTEAAGGMQVDHAGLARGLGIAVGHGHHAGFLQAHDVADVLAPDEGVDERQFGGTGIAEDVLDPLGFEGFKQYVGTASGGGCRHDGPFLHGLVSRLKR